MEIGRITQLTERKDPARELAGDQFGEILGSLTHPVSMRHPTHAERIQAALVTASRLQREIGKLLLEYPEDVNLLEAFMKADDAFRDITGHKLHVEEESKPKEPVKEYLTAQDEFEAEQGARP